MLSFKPGFSLCSFTFIKRLFSSSSLSAIRVVSYAPTAYLRLLIFLPAILIPACVSSSPVFLMMYSAYKLNKQGDNIQPGRTPFPIWNQSVVPCPFLTVAYFLIRDGNIEAVKLKHLLMSDYVNTNYLTWSNSRPRFLNQNMMLCFSAKKTISSSQCKATREMHRLFFLSRRGGPWCKLRLGWFQFSR